MKLRFFPIVIAVSLGCQNLFAAATLVAAPQMVPALATASRVALIDSAGQITNGPANLGTAAYSNAPAFVASSAGLGTNTTLYSVTNANQASNQISEIVQGRTGQNTNLVEWQSPAGTIVSGVKSNGTILIPDGSANFPAVGFKSEDDGTGTGLYLSSAGVLAIAANGTGTRWLFAGNGANGLGNAGTDYFLEDLHGGRLLIRSNNSFAFAFTTATSGGTSDLDIYRLGAGIAAIGTGNHTGFAPLAAAKFIVTNSVNSTVYGMVGGTFTANNTLFTNLGPSTVLTNLANVNIPASTLTNTADRIHARWGGIMQTAIVNTNEFKIVFGSQTILDTGLVTASNGTFVVECEIWRTGNTAQHVEAYLDWSGSAGVPWARTNVNLELTQTNGLITNLALQGAARLAGAHTNNSFRVEYFPTP